MQEVLNYNVCQKRTELILVIDRHEAKDMI